MKTGIKVPKLFEDGNAFVILAKCRKPAIRAGWTDDEWKKFTDGAKQGDFDHLVQTVMKHFEEA